MNEQMEDTQVKPETLLCGNILFCNISIIDISDQNVFSLIFCIYLRWFYERFESKTISSVPLYRWFYIFH